MSINKLIQIFDEVYDNECDCNEGEFTFAHLTIVYNLIEIFKTHTTKEERKLFLGSFSEILNIK